jgi:hypothetical protein
VGRLNERRLPLRRDFARGKRAARSPLEIHLRAIPRSGKIPRTARLEKRRLGVIGERQEIVSLHCEESHREARRESFLPSARLNLVNSSLIIRSAVMLGASREKIHHPPARNQSRNTVGELLALPRFHGPLKRSAGPSRARSGPFGPGRVHSGPLGLARTYVIRIFGLLCYCGASRRIVDQSCVRAILLRSLSRGSEKLYFLPFPGPASDQ